MPLEKAAQLARIEETPAEASAGYIRAVRTLWNADAGKVKDELTSVLSLEGSKVTALAGSNGILLAGLKPQVLQALELLAALDAPFESTVREVPVEQGDPAAIVSLIERVRAARKSSGAGPLKGTLLAAPEARSIVVVAPLEELTYWDELIDRFDRTQPTTTVNYTPVRFGLDETRKLIEEVVGPHRGSAETAIRLVSDELTGTLIITATSSQHSEIEKLLARLESAPRADRWSIRSIPVRNRKVSDLLSLTQELLEVGAILPPDEPDAELPEAEADSQATGGRPAPASRKTNDEIAGEQPVAGMFVGSKNSEVFHFPECSVVGRIKPSNLVSFDSEPAGKRLHQGCPWN